MKRILILVITTLSLSYNLFSQTIIAFDYMETSNWNGLWFNSGNLSSNGGQSTWATNVSVSSNVSAVLYGAGNGSSFIEQDWYVLPNITGLDPNKLYQLQFKLASHSFTAPTANTRGVDMPDFVEVQVSYNGGLSYISELRITGNSNSQFPYSSTGIISHIANGSFTNSSPPTGDVYQTPSGINTTGFSTVILALPTGTTQIAVDILCRVNAVGEEWWLDNIELVEVNTLPVELTFFNGKTTQNGNQLTWQTASEYNADYYMLKYSTDGEFTNIIAMIPATGTTNQTSNYYFIHDRFERTINYYQLIQVDLDGTETVYPAISIDNRGGKKLVKIINIMGQEVNEMSGGIYFELYDDGSMIKIIK